MVKLPGEFLQKVRSVQKKGFQIRQTQDYLLTSKL